MSKALVVLAFLGLLVFAFGLKSNQGETMTNDIAEPASPAAYPPGAKTLYVAGGCFWCIESQMEELKGVYDAVSGYAGGTVPHATYEEVCSGRTGHAEVVKIVYDPKVISADDLLSIFFTIHDPTTLNRQGPDHGTQYRSAIFYTNGEEKAEAEKVRDQVAKAKIWKDPIVTSIEPLTNWTQAEEYHQNYFVKYEHATPQQRMTMNSGYCAAIVEPHVLAFRKHFKDRLKK